MYNIKQLENVIPAFPSRVYSKKMVKELRILGHSAFTIVVNKNEKVMFFVSSHVFGCGVLPKSYVPITFTVPSEIVPRPGCETGVIRTIDDYLDLFHPNHKLIESTKELVEYLNSPVVKE